MLCPDIADIESLETAGATMVLGIVFLGIKSIEYYTSTRRADAVRRIDFIRARRPRPRRPMFFDLYFLMTGVHAVHMVSASGS